MPSDKRFLVEHWHLFAKSLLLSIPDIELSSWSNHIWTYDLEISSLRDFQSHKVSYGPISVLETQWTELLLKPSCSEHLEIWIKCYFKKYQHIAKLSGKNGKYPGARNVKQSRNQAQLSLQNSAGVDGGRWAKQTPSLHKAKAHNMLLFLVKAEISKTPPASPKRW